MTGLNRLVVGGSLADTPPSIFQGDLHPRRCSWRREMPSAWLAIGAAMVGTALGALAQALL